MTAYRPYVLLHVSFYLCVIASLVPDLTNEYHAHVDEKNKPQKMAETMAANFEQFLCIAINLEIKYPANVN